jgi:hypothetical protein
MSDSVLDRIRQNRQRASVPPRNDALISRAQGIDLAEVPAAQDLPTAIESASPSMSGDAMEELKAELEQIPETIRHSAIVLEKELDQKLTRYCKDHRITVEVFLEAAWLHVSSNQDAMDEILVEAKQRYADRKRAGKLRRLITMLEGKS